MGSASRASRPHLAPSRRGFLQRVAFASLGLVAGSARLVADAHRAAHFVDGAHGFVRLGTGRQLAYAEYGDPAGQKVVFYHHGLPSCRMDNTFLDALRAKPGVRVISVDRPGIGQSDVNPCGSFLTWPEDLAGVADALRISRFAVMGCSGGAPFALAAARALPERVTAVSLACPMAPLEAGPFDCFGARGPIMAQRHPLLARLALGRYAENLRRNPDRFPTALNVLSPVDRALFADRSFRRNVARITTEAFRQGPIPVTNAVSELAQPWSHWLKDVKTKVHLIQGCSDTVTAPTMAYYLARALPDADIRYIPEAGHCTLCCHHAPAILAAALAS